MNAKQMLLDYAAKHLRNTKSVDTAEQFCGKAMTEGIVIDRTSNSKTICNIRREGKTIVVNETTITSMVDGSKKEETAEIFRVNL